MVARQETTHCSKIRSLQAASLVEFLDDPARAIVGEKKYRRCLSPRNRNW